MNAARAFAIVLCSIIVLFVILPSLVRTKPVAATHSIATVDPVYTHATGPATGPTCTGPTVAQISLAQEHERCLDRDMLKSYYPPPLVETTPVDYPRRAIGACPVSKPQSRELPQANIPMWLFKN